MKFCFDKPFTIRRLTATMVIADYVMNSCDDSDVWLDSEIEECVRCAAGIVNSETFAHVVLQIGDAVDTSDAVNLLDLHDVQLLLAKFRLKR